ncbi:MAG: tRNA (adenosine(37)-N6)-threonylcarbamoyltransferase complex dimerization subunit type 1 TsaB [Candidatus Kryptoniota bacterium]
MPRILSIETATKICSAAIVENGHALADFTVVSKNVHVERLMPMIISIFENSHLKFSDIDAIAVSIGPGSFTGLRIGLSTAKGIAYALDKKIVAVPTLDAIAYRLRASWEGKKIFVVLHARTNEFYLGEYQLKGEKLVRIDEYKVASTSEILSLLTGDEVLTGEGAELLLKSGVTSKLAPEELRSASALSVGLIGEEKFMQGEFAEIESVVPLYLKDFVAVRGNPLTKIQEKI